MAKLLFVCCVFVVACNIIHCWRQMWLIQGLCVLPKDAAALLTLSVRFCRVAPWFNTSQGKPESSSPLKSTRCMLYMQLHCIRYDQNQLSLDTYTVSLSTSRYVLPKAIGLVRAHYNAGTRPCVAATNTRKQVRSTVVPCWAF